MSLELKVADPDELADGGRKLIDMQGVPVALFRIGADYFAISNRCPHKGRSLIEGELEDCRITCPGHGWDFDLRTGETSWDPLIHKTYTLRVGSDGIYIVTGA